MNMCHISQECAPTPYKHFLSSQWHEHFEHTNCGTVVIIMKARENINKTCQLGWQALAGRCYLGKLLQ